MDEVNENNTGLIPDNLQSENVITNSNLNEIDNVCYDMECLNTNNNNITPITVTLFLNESNRSIVIKTQNTKTILYAIKYKDFVSFIDETEMKPEIKNKIQQQFNLNNQNKTLCLLTYIPLISKTKCTPLFCCSCSCKQHYNEREVKTLHLLIENTNIDKVKQHISLFCSKIHLNELQSKNRKRKLLFFVNPVSGPGLSVKIWNRAKAILDQTDIAYDVIFTERVRHAYDVVLNVGLNDYDGIVNCSGDGILHEIVNGIFHREDKDIFANRVVVAALPAGSGNAFSKAITAYCGEDNSIESHVYIILKGKYKKVDLQEMELRDVEKKVYSFLSLTYGMIADIDLESEVIRCCGMVRTTIWGVLRWICLRDYYGALYTLPQNSNMDLNMIPSIKENIDEGLFVKENDNWRLFIAGNTQYIGETIKPLPKARIDDGYNDIVSLKASTSGRCLLFKEMVMYMDDGDSLLDKDGNIAVQGVNYCKTKFWRLIPKLSLHDPDDVNNKLTFQGFFSIDGERYPICPVQCKTLEKVLNVYCTKD